MAAKKHTSKADQFEYANLVYQQALEDAANRLGPMLETATKRARKFLRKQGINLTQDQISAYFKRQKQKPAQLTPEQEAKNKEWARKSIREAADMLVSAFNACGVVESGHELGRFDYVESGRFARLAVEETGRKLREHL